MKILIIGSGAREHALGWKLKQESAQSKLYFAPGNGGTSALGVNVHKEDGVAWSGLAKKLGAHFVAIGPEAPLAEGAADRMRRAGIGVFGPGEKAARLESSKIFAKDFCHKWEIPTAQFRVFDDLGFALNYCQKASYPMVVKADGLAQGKGVVVVGGPIEAQKIIRSFMETKVLGEAGRRIVAEEYLQGDELSLMAFFDGNNFVLLPGARDYKRLHDNNLGPNTGGMGSTAPVDLPDSFWPSIEELILNPFRQGLESEGIDYQGLIYFGLMLTKKGPKLLEFNARFGDPETQALVGLTDLPFLELMQAAAEGMLSKFERYLFLNRLAQCPQACACVVLASPGYPGKPATGFPIQGINGSAPKGTLFFHAGTKQEKGRLLTAGGRVLSVVGKEKTADKARRRAYQALKAVRFEGMQYRKDIG